MQHAHSTPRAQATKVAGKAADATGDDMNKARGPLRTQGCGATLVLRVSPRAARRTAPRPSDPGQKLLEAYRQAARMKSPFLAVRKITDQRKSETCLDRRSALCFVSTCSALGLQTRPGHQKIAPRGAHGRPNHPKHAKNNQLRALFRCVTVTTGKQNVLMFSYRINRLVCRGALGF